jgi:hypothetical protein
LTDIFGCDQLPKLLIFAFLGQETRLVSIHFNIDLFDNFLENLIIDIGKEFVQLRKVDMILILLQKADNVGLGPSLDKVLVSSALWIVNFHVSLWLNLAHKIDLLKFSHKNLVFTVLILVHDAQEVVLMSLMIEYWTIVHVVFKNSNTFSLVINLSKQRYFLASFLHHLDTIWSHVPKILVF